RQRRRLHPPGEGGGGGGGGAALDVAHFIRHRDSGGGGPPRRGGGGGAGLNATQAIRRHPNIFARFLIIVSLLCDESFLRRQRSPEAPPPSTALRAVPLPRYRGGGYLRRQLLERVEPLLRRGFGGGAPAGAPLAGETPPGER